MNELDLEELAMAWFKDIGYQPHVQILSQVEVLKSEQNIKM